MNIKKFFTKEVKIGIASIAALCVLVYGINYLKGIHMFKPTSYFFVKYSNVNGLSKSSPVFADGVKVGIVRDIDFDRYRPGNVIVEVKLDRDIRIPVGSSAELVTDMLGGIKMNILLATNMRESYSIGDTIPGVVNDGLMEAVTGIVPKIEGLVPKLDSILISLNTILRDENIPATLNSVRNIATNLEATSSHINVLMRKDIPELTAKMNTIGDNFVKISTDLREADMAKTFQRVDQTLANVKEMTDKLGRRDNTLGLLLNDAELYNNLNLTMGNTASLLNDLQTNPKRYVHFSLFGKKNK